MTKEFKIFLTLAASVIAVVLVVMLLLNAAHIIWGIVKAVIFVAIIIAIVWYIKNKISKS
jgi:hypothetical protein